MASKKDLNIFLLEKNNFDLLLIQALKYEVLELYVPTFSSSVLVVRVSSTKGNS